jgi:hypothetical protein
MNQSLFRRIVEQLQPILKPLAIAAVSVAEAVVIWSLC